MKKSAIYLGKMGIGWIIGILSSILLLSALFEKNIYFMSSLFFGLSLGAIPFILRSQWENIKGKYINIGYNWIEVKPKDEDDIANQLYSCLLPDCQY